MLNLGTFIKDEKTGKLTGVFYGVNMYPTNLVFEPETSREGKLYYKIFAQSQNTRAEAGAAWLKASKHEKGKPYIDVKLDSPGLAGTFFGRLNASDGAPNQYHLTWNEAKHAPKADANAAPAEAPVRRQPAALTP
jgi:uncharacterized protein (DUF736 family)